MRLFRVAAGQGIPESQGKSGKVFCLKCKSFFVKISTLTFFIANLSF